MNLNQFESMFMRLRYVTLVAVIASGLGSWLMFIIGALKVFAAYKVYFSSDLLDTTLPNEAANFAITYLIQAVDTFLIGLVFAIFAGGIYTLYIRRTDREAPEVLSWIKIQNISQLKSILAELVIIILFVKFLEGALKITIYEFQWQMLSLPAGILMLAIALRLMGLRKTHD